MASHCHRERGGSARFPEAGSATGAKYNPGPEGGSGQSLAVSERNCNHSFSGCFGQRAGRETSGLVEYSL